MDRNEYLKTVSQTLLNEFSETEQNNFILDLFTSLKKNRNEKIATLRKEAQELSKNNSELMLIIHNNLK